MCPYHFTNKEVTDDSKVRDWSGWAGYSFCEQLLKKQSLRGGAPKNWLPFPRSVILPLDWDSFVCTADKVLSPKNHTKMMGELFPSKN